MNNSQNNKCIMPWVHLEVQPNGFVTPCCMNNQLLLNDNGEAIDMNVSTISQAWKSPTIKKIRQQFTKGEIPASCTTCVNVEKSSYKSMRQRKNDEFLKYFSFFDDNNLKGPISLDLKFGNLCNLKCRICSPEQSSSWLHESLQNNEAKYLKDKKQSFLWPQTNPDFWKDLSLHMSNLKYFDIFGGEPLLINEHIIFLKNCVKSGFSNEITLSYSTNGTIYSKELIEDIWPNFKSVTLLFSIDDIGKRFEYQRHPARWEFVENNIKSYLKNKNLNYLIGCTVNIYNIYYLEELFLWAQKMKIKIWFNLLHDPSFLCIQNIPSYLKSIINEKYKKRVNSEKFSELIIPVLAFMNQQRGKETFDDFLLYSSKIDTRRNELFQTTFLEFFQQIRS